jgi:hypothetical protein
MKFTIILYSSVLAIVTFPALAQNAAPTIPGPGIGGAPKNASNITGGPKTPNEAGRSISKDNAASPAVPANDRKTVCPFSN